MEERHRSALIDGVAALNRGAYHDALDSFELPYRELRGPERAFFLALVRTAAALYHFAGGRSSSAARLYESASELFSQRGELDAGLDIAAFQTDLQGVFAPLLSADKVTRAELRPERAPQLAFLTRAREA